MLDNYLNTLASGKPAVIDLLPDRQDRCINICEMKFLGSAGNAHAAEKQAVPAYNTGVIELM